MCQPCDPPVDSSWVIWITFLSNSSSEPSRHIIQNHWAYASSIKRHGSSKALHSLSETGSLTLGIWAIIKGWLDPVVASKIHFTRSADDLEKFIPRGRIVKELEGDEQFEWTYVEPVPGENDIMKDTATRDRIQEEREGMFRRFEESTKKWIAGDDSAVAERDAIAKEMNENYWRLDPYVRARTVYDRVGVIGRKGGWIYPKSETTEGGSTEIKADVSPTEGDKEKSEARA